MDIIAHPSLNCNARRNGGLPEIIVLHYTAMETADKALTRLCSEQHEVSAHYLLGETGSVWQMVKDADRAWHAGIGAWGRITDVNSHSIGIELANPGDRPFPQMQMAALEMLLARLMKKWGIAPEKVIAHSDLAPSRKIDPGSKFDWRRLALSGLSIWPEGGDVGAESEMPIRFETAARSIGYRGESPDVLNAFRIRFHTNALGEPLCARDVLAAENIATRFPCP